MHKPHGPVRRINGVKVRVSDEGTICTSVEFSTSSRRDLQYHQSLGQSFIMIYASFGMMKCFAILCKATIFVPSTAKVARTVRTKVLICRALHEEFQTATYCDTGHRSMICISCTLYSVSAACQTIIIYLTFH